MCSVETPPKEDQTYPTRQCGNRVRDREMGRGGAARGRGCLAPCPVTHHTPSADPPAHQPCPVSFVNSSPLSTSAPITLDPGLLSLSG